MDLPAAAKCDSLFCPQLLLEQVIIEMITSLTSHKLIKLTDREAFGRFVHLKLLNRVFSLFCEPLCDRSSSSHTLYPYSLLSQSVSSIITLARTEKYGQKWIEIQAWVFVAQFVRGSAKVPHRSSNLIIVCVWYFVPNAALNRKGKPQHPHSPAFKSHIYI